MDGNGDPVPCPTPPPTDSPTKQPTASPTPHPNGDCETACLGMLFNPVFEASSRFGGFPRSPIFDLPQYFDYTIPAVLPSPRTHGFFLHDIVQIKDLTAENFVVDVFEEFMGCAVSTYLSDKRRWHRSSHYFIITQIHICLFLPFLTKDKNCGRTK